MLDLHIHVLPAIDDGPTDLADSISMLERAADLGFTGLVATPHLVGKLDDEFASLTKRRLAELLPHATTCNLELLSGYEVRLTPDVGRRLLSGEAICLGQSSVVLVELPFSGWPIFTEQALFDIQAAGFTALLAHPERYAAAIESPDRIFALRDRGVLMQVTTGSLAGLFGKHAQTLAERLLREGVADVLASDAHSAGRRFVSVSEGLAQAERLVGSDRVRQLTTGNPRALLSGSQLPEWTGAGARATESGATGPWQFVRNLLPGR